jgi:hypothetical protein
MYKIITTAFALLIAQCAYSQGLEDVIVEKYYVSDAADAAGSSGVLPVGSVTYRVYIDLLPGYNFQALYGVQGHFLTVSTTTSFFNNEDYGNTSPNSISATNIRKNTAMIDSWFSVGATCNGKLGVLKSEDTDGSVGNANGILANADPSAGTPLTSSDGMLAGTPVAVTFVGINNTGNGDLAVLDGISQAGNLFTTDNGSVAALGGVTGPTASNRILVGQFTTDGIFSFELNVQVGTASGGIEQFVASNPVGTEIQFPGLVYNSSTTSVPVVSQSENPIQIYPNPSNGIVHILANEQLQSPINYEVYNCNGALVSVVESALPAVTTIIDLTKEPSGLYLITYCTLSKSGMLKVVKN